MATVQIRNAHSSKRLTYRLAYLVIMSALGIGIVFSFGQILVDYREEKQTMSTKIEEAIASVKPAAEVAIYEVDTVLTHQIASGLFKNKAIIRVVIRDNLAGTLIDVSQRPTPSSLEWLTRLLFGDFIERTLPLFDIKRPNVINGELEVVLDPHHFTADFLQRVVLVLISGIARNVILTLAIFILFYSVVTKPLLRLASEVSSINSQIKGEKLLSIPPGHENDELGVLVDAFNRMGQSLREAQQKLLAYNQSLENQVQQEKSLGRLKDEFLATVSHELRTPINGIAGALELLVEKAEDKPSQHYIRIAKNATDQLTQIVNDILSYSDIQAGTIKIQAKETEIANLLQDLIDQFRRIEKPDVTINCELSNNLPSILLVDAPRLKTIVFHLLRNALQFTEVGEIKLIAAIEQNPGEKFPSVLNITVVDNGIGISETDLQKIWEKFRQVDGSYSRSYQGLGIGLPLCKALLDCMDGKIELISTPNQGTSVTIQLPITLVNKEVLSLNDGELNIGQKRTLLIVEDNPTNLLILEKMLAQLGCKTLSADNGRVAIELLDNQRPVLDAILMDCQMPVMDGFEATREIRKMVSYRAIPIIAVTANIRDCERELCIEAGMNDHIEKPVSKDQLIKILCRWLSSQTDQDEPPTQKQ